MDVTSFNLHTHYMTSITRRFVSSKQSTPILASMKPPPYPGDIPEPCTRIWIIAFNRFARYYLTAFFPWNIHTGKVPYPFDFEGYSAFVGHMEEHSCFLYNARTFMMESTMRGLMQICKKLVATQMYKSRNVDHRLGNCFEGPQLNDLVCTCD